MSASTENFPLPDFLVIGAMKAGTTSLYHDLRSQPGVFLPDKESNALLAGDPARAMTSLLGKADTGSIRGEVCPDYTKPDFDVRSAETAHALYADRPPPKIIYLVRHPIERLLSHHYFVSTQHGDANPGGMTPDLEASLRDFPELVETSRYAARLAPWIDAFGQDALLVIRFEDYVAGRAGAVKGVLEFLGIGELFDPKNIEQRKVHNPGESRPVATPFWRRIMKHPAYRKLLRPLLPLGLRDRIRALLLPRPPPRPDPPSPETRARLAEIFRPEIAVLEELIGAKESLWKLDADGEDG